MSTDEQLTSIRDDLASLIERVDDLTLSALHEAADAGETERPEIDRQLMRVRRALERALAVLTARG